MIKLSKMTYFTHSWLAPKQGLAVFISLLSLLTPGTVSEAAEEVKDNPVIVETSVRPLPGALDKMPMFNSNSPEIVRTSGILLSLLSKEGKKNPDAHLDFPLQGKFRVFTHHINNRIKQQDNKVLFLGLIAYNPDTSPANIRISRATSYVSQPDAPFIKLPPLLSNPKGLIYAGPGDRITNDFLRDEFPTGWPSKINIPAKSYALIYCLPVKVQGLHSQNNGRSTLLELFASKKVQLCEVAEFVKAETTQQELPPALERFVEIAESGELSLERDKLPSAPGAKGPLIYGRVAGCQIGSIWKGVATDGEKNITRLTVPEKNKAISFPIASLLRGTFATGQVQTAPLVARYPDTAYAAHGNYAVEYRLKFPLFNPEKSPVRIHLSLDTPVKTDQTKENLTYFEPPSSRTFYRGTVLVQYLSDKGDTTKDYVHLVETRGEKSADLCSIKMRPKGHRTIQLSLFYPPDATPPQVVTLKSTQAE
ncbi:MAG: DUF3370 domain-containing protein [Leptolyngbya sp.]|nr:DUF3370 domain-containing protein [Candidatus Melainabacteria bacterium]